MNEGERLRAFVDQRWGRADGGIRGLAAAIGTSADTLYHWFDGTSSINAYHLGKLAEALNVKRWEIVAAMDGEGPVVPLDETTRAALRAEIEAILDERLGPRQAARAREREAG